MKNIFRLVCCGIFLIPFSGLITLGSNPLWYSQLLALMSVFCIGVAIKLWDFNKPLALLNLYSWFSVYFVAHVHPRSIVILLIINFSSLTIQQISRMRDHQKNKIILCLFILFIIQSIWVTLQYFNLDPIFDLASNTNLDDTVGLSGSKNQISLFFSDLAPLAYSYHPFLIIVNILGLAINKTTTCWVAFIVSFLVFISYWNKKIFIISLVSCAVISSVFLLKFDSFNNIKFQERISLWKSSTQQVILGRAVMDMDIYKEDRGNMFKIVRCNPFFGFGLGSFMRISPYTQTEWLQIKKRGGHRYAHAHNDYIEWFFEMGWVGLCLLVFCLGDIFIRFFRSNKSRLLLISFCGILSHMISALGIFTIQTAVSGMLLIIFLGIFYSETSYE